MPEAMLDGRALRVPAGTMILQAARDRGIVIPSLCHQPDLDHHTSCMVCMVEEQASGRLVPSCATPVQDGQRILTGSVRARDARRHAVELLLAEHAGDCEAPCTRVCPARLDVPSILRRISRGDRRGAALLVREATEHPCQTCGAPCQRACRRSILDRALDIRSLLIRLEAEGTLPPPRSGVRRFDSHSGRAEAVVLQALAAAAEARAARGHPESADPDSMEALRCLGCDCARKVSCSLRALAEEIGADPGRLRLHHSPLVPCRSGGGVSFAPGKCIKCGICVRISDRDGTRPGIAFNGRGSSVEVRGALGADIGSALGESAPECIARCPTGALAGES